MTISLRRRPYWAILAVSGALSACATGTTSSFTQAPIAFSDASGSVTDVSGQTTAAVLAEGGDFTHGVPSFSAVSGNAILPVNAPVAEAALPSTTLQALGPSASSSESPSGPVVTATAAATTPLAGVAAGAGSQPGSLTTAITTPAASVQLGAQASPGAIAAQLSGAAPGAPVLSANLSAGPPTQAASAVLAPVTNALRPATAALTAPTAAPATSQVATLAAPVAAATAPGTSNALSTRGAILAPVGAALSATVPATSSTANSLLTTTTLQQARARMCSPLKPAC